MLQIEKIDLSIPDFIGDLTESICIIQKEGLVFNFTHRSFQEYFSSYCLSNLIEAQFSSIIDNFIIRTNDNVVKMLFEMNPDKFEVYYLIPHLERIIAELSSLMPNFDVNINFKYLQISVYAVRQGREYALAFSAEGHDGLLIDACTRLYAELLQARYNRLQRDMAKDKAVIKKMFADDQLQEGVVKVIRDHSENVSARMQEREQFDTSLLAECGTADALKNVWAALKKTHKRIVAKHQRRNKSIDDLLGLGIAKT